MRLRFRADAGSDVGDKRMFVRNSILIRAAVAAIAAASLSASDFVAPATAASLVKETMLKSLMPVWGRTRTL
jgi:hypothetical protein